MLRLVQNDLFDVGADLCRPGHDTETTPLRVTEKQTVRVERHIDRFNEMLNRSRVLFFPGEALPLPICITPGRWSGAPSATLRNSPLESINPEALKYVNRLSDLLFVLARYCNGRGTADVLWKPGANR